MLCLCLQGYGFMWCSTKVDGMMLSFQFRISCHVQVSLSNSGCVRFSCHFNQDGMLKESGYSFRTLILCVYVCCCAIHVYIYIYIYIYTYMYVYIYTYVSLSLYICIYIYIDVLISIYIYIYIYIYIVITIVIIVFSCLNYYYDNH